MGLFEFVAVIVSMILALAIGRLLAGAAELVKNRRRVQWYLPHALWLGCLHMLGLSFWWSLWDFQDFAWNFVSFLYVSVPPTILFFLVVLVFPDTPGDGDVDLESHFLDVRRFFLSLLLVYAVFTWLDGPIWVGQAVFGPVGWLNVVMATGILLALVVRKHWVQVAVPAVLILQFFTALILFRFLPGSGG